TTKKLTKKIEKEIFDKYQKANKRILFLDYDGTLVGFKDKPSQAKPTADVYEKLDKLAADPKNEVVLVSGRDKETFDKWFSGKNYTLITEHGAWAKEPNGEWKVAQTINTDWKKQLLPILEFYEDRTPGTFLEEKSYSYVWHYRKSDPELGIGRANELKDQLTSLVANHDLEILEGNKVIEVKNSGTNKGKAALRKMGSETYDFVFGIGDDWTDEYLFKDLPENAFTLKVGGNNTIAKYSIDTHKDVLALLGKFTE
ncbi:MAG: trehalose-phosphatase, partial [Salinivirgaceae bacterium]